VPLNPVLVAYDRFKRIQADLLCLPEILFSNCAVSWPACTDKPPGPDLNCGPSGPDGHTGHAHCSVVAYATVPQGQACDGAMCDVLSVCLFADWSVTHCYQVINCHIRIVSCGVWHWNWSDASLAVWTIRFAYNCNFRRKCRTNILLFICVFFCCLKCIHKNAVFSKTKQFTAMIYWRPISLTWAFQRTQSLPTLNVDFKVTFVIFGFL